MKKHSNAEIFGIDISAGMIREAVKRNVYSMVCRADAENLPFGDQSFRNVYSSFVLHSVLNQRRALAEVHRVLKPGGSAILVDLCPVGRSMWLAVALGFLHSCLWEHGAPSRYVPVETYVRLALEVGFTITRVRPIGAKKRYQHFLLSLRKEEI